MNLNNCKRRQIATILLRMAVILHSCLILLLRFTVISQQALDNLKFSN